MRLAFFHFYLEIADERYRGKEHFPSRVVDTSFNTHGTCFVVGSSFLCPSPLLFFAVQHLVERVYTMFNTEVNIHMREMGLSRKFSLCRINDITMDTLKGFKGLSPQLSIMRKDLSKQLVNVVHCRSIMQTQGLSLNPLSPSEVPSQLIPGNRSSSPI